MLSDAAIKRLLAACGGADFGSRRDLALIRVLLACPRRGEVVSIQVGADHLVLKRGTATADQGSPHRAIFTVTLPPYSE